MLCASAPPINTQRTGTARREDHSPASNSLQFIHAAARYGTCMRFVYMQEPCSCTSTRMDLTSCTARTRHLLLACIHDDARLCPILRGLSSCVRACGYLCVGALIMAHDAKVRTRARSLDRTHPRTTAHARTGPDGKPMSFGSSNDEPGAAPRKSAKVLD